MRSFSTRAILVLAILAGCGSDPTPASGPMEEVQNAPDSASISDSAAVDAGLDSVESDIPPTVDVSSRAGYVFPPPEDLPERATPPDLLVTFDGTAVTTPELWREVRVPELHAVLDHYLYGRAPAPSASVVTLDSTASLLGGTVVLDQYTVSVDGAADLALHVAVFRPPGDGPYPVWLALNPCGNQSVLADPAIRLTTAFQEINCVGDTPEQNRGTQADRFPVALIVEHGFALAAIHQSEIAHDDAMAGDVGFRAALPVDGDPGTRWGVLQAWAFGVAHVARAVPEMAALDRDRIAVVGHSRRGKVALLAAAMEPTIGLVVSHQSGTAGARLSRSEEGEPISAITLAFPHWFDAHFAAFSDRASYLPLDQHFLLALVAPRPLLLSNGAEDSWAGPDGTREAANLASPAWTLLGSSGLGGDNDLDATLAYNVRGGDHSLGAVDWEVFLAFAEGKWE